MTLKVLIYSHDWAPSVGGVETVTMGLARGLAKWSETHVGETVEVTVVTQTPVGGMDDTQLPFRVARRASKLELAKLVRSADVIHIANAAFAPLALAWLLSKPSVLEHDGYQSVCPNGLLIYEPDRSVCPGHFMAGRYTKCIRCNAESLGWARSLRSLLLAFPRRWLSRRVSRNIAPTRHIGRRVRLPQTQVILHGVPDCVPSNVTHATNHDDTAPCFAYVGRLVPEKGLSVMFRAASKLLRNGYSFRLRIVGNGPDRRHLEEMAKDFGLADRTEFVGAVSVAATHGLLQDAAAVIMPSVWEDVAPLAASEQLMQGNLLIASDIGGLGEIVDGAGLTFPPGDDDALESCMRQVIDNPELANELRAQARGRGAELFSEERMVEEHLQLYRELSRSP